jgi:FeS assembly SUF system regulator
MIRLTRQADYGVVVMTHFARHAGFETTTTRDVAAETHLPLPMAGKILKALAKGGLLESHRGVNGGYCLARAPDEISVADIITAIEGPIGMTECSGEEADGCNIEGLCAVRGNWQLVNRVVQQALERITLAHMASPMPCDFEVVEAHPRGEPLPSLSVASRQETPPRR